MEIKELPNITLLFVLVGMLIGVGVLILANFSDATKDSVTIAYPNENVTLTGGTATLANGNVTTLSTFGNASNTSQTYSIGSTVNLTNAEAGTIKASLSDGTYSVGYVYQDSTSASTGIDSATSVVGSIAEDWLSLLITITILGFILFLVIRSFAGKSR